MLIKREGNLFIVYKNRDSMFESHDFNECVLFVNDNGGFDEARKKIKERSYIVN